MLIIGAVLYCLGRARAEVRRKRASPSAPSRTVTVAAEAVDEHDAAIEEDASAVTLDELPPEPVQR